MDTLTTEKRDSLASAIAGAGDVAELTDALEAAADATAAAKPKRTRPSRSKAAKAERAAAASTNVVPIKRATGAKKQTPKARQRAAAAATTVGAKSTGVPNARSIGSSEPGRKFRLYHDGKPQTDVQNKLSSIAYDFTKDLAGDGSPRVGVKTFRAILADGGVSDPDGSAWKVTLDNGHVIESKAI